jgi:D-alanine-D-alanine ligase
MTPLSFEYPISIAILYFDGTAADMEDTKKSVRGITEALQSLGHVVRSTSVNKKNWRRAVRLPGEIVFNLVEDDGWELYMKVGKRLEELGRAQVAHDIHSFRYVTRKASIKRKFEKSGIPTPKFRILNRRSSWQVRGLEYPLIVKPSGQHAGIGISQDSVVIDQDELNDRLEYLFKHFPGEMIVEEYIDGREIHLTVMGNGRRVVALPPAEIDFHGEYLDNWNIYSYNSKWEAGTWEYWDTSTLVSKLSRKMEKKVCKDAVRAFRALGCRDIVRLDMRLDEKKQKAYVVDLNMNPSLNAYEVQDATYVSTHAIGWSFAQFVETLIAITYKRVYGKLPDRMRDRRLLLANPLHKAI